MDRQDHMASAEAERHRGKGADGSPWVTSVLVPASAKLDDPSVERLQRPVVVRVAAVAGEPRDHLMEAGHRGVRDLTSGSEH